MPDPLRTNPSSARRWAVIALLCVGMIIAYIDRANLSVALADKGFLEHFGLNDIDRGTLNSAFFWSYAVLQIPAGFLVDRFGVKGPYAIGFLGWSLVSALTAFAGSFRQVLMLRLLLGVGEAVVTPASLRWIRFNVEEKQRGLAVGLLFAGAKIGPAIGALLAGPLLEAYGWRTMFLVLGLGCMLWLLPWMTMVRNDDREIEASSLSQSGAETVSFSALMATPAIWGIVIGTFCYNYFNYYCMTWLPSYLVEHHGLSLSSMSWYSALSFGGMATVAAFGGWWADRMIARGADPIRIRKRFTIAGFLVASTEVFGAMSDSSSIALFFAVISLSGLGLTTANYWALTQTLMPGAAIGRIAGIQNCASNLAGVAAPLITGWLKEHTGGYTAPMQAIWFILVAGIISYVVLVRPELAKMKKGAAAA